MTAGAAGHVSSGDRQLLPASTASDSQAWGGSTRGTVRWNRTALGAYRTSYSMRTGSVRNLALPLALLFILVAFVVSCTAGDETARTTTTVPPAGPGDKGAETTTSVPPAGPLSGEQLASALRGGGYVIYFRHAATDPVPGDADPVVLSDCDTQRNLSEAGRAQARGIGQAMGALEIPIGRVLSSAFCRALDTARLAFEQATVEPALENLRTAGDQAERDTRTEGLRGLLSAVPEGGTNVILVAHGFNITAAADVSIAEGEAAIFRPEGEGRFTLVGRVTPNQWAELAEQLATDREPTVREYPVPAGSRPHDVAPAPDGTVWYTAQGAGELGRLDPGTGEVERVPLGQGSAPHGVIVGPDGAAWVTDSGLNAIVRVDPGSLAVTPFPLPGNARANLNTAAFDGNGVLWFTGQQGYYGRVDPASGRVQVFDAPRGVGPYGITGTPEGDIYYASLAGSYIARIDSETGRAVVLDPPTRGQGARRIWSDSQGRLWISEWNAGQLGMYDPAADSWREWKLPGSDPQPYAVFVDDQDVVWMSDFGANALVRFDPKTEEFIQIPLPHEPGNVRQILGRPGEVWGAESAADALIVVQ